MFDLRHACAVAGAMAVAAAVVVTSCITPLATAADATSLEAESMSIAPAFNASVVRDSTASGGSAVLLRRNATASKTLTLPASAQIVVRALGVTCNGAPTMAVTVDGKSVGTTSVTATTWTDYPMTTTIAAGSHGIAVAFTNQGTGLRCTRTLSLDSVVIVPVATPVTTTPVTTTPTTTTSTTPTTTTPTTTTTTSTTPTTTTSTTPTTTTTTPSTGPLTVAPVADLPGWKHVFADDFTKDAPVGSWANSSDPNTIVYTGANGQQWRTYPSTYTDTYQHRPYRSDQVLSVSNGTLIFNLHNVDGQPAGANPSPLLANGSQYQTYGRYSARLRVDTPDLSEYHIAWLLWPQSEKWPDDGEIDWPEGSLAGTSSAFAHYASSAGGQDTVDTGVPFTGWHVYTIEWKPGRVRFLLDDTVVLESTKNVPSKPMRWQLQTETDGNGTHAGHLLVDWVSAWSSTGS